MTDRWTDRIPISISYVSTAMLMRDKNWTNRCMLCEYGQHKDSSYTNGHIVLTANTKQPFLYVTKSRTFYSEISRHWPAGDACSLSKFPQALAASYDLCLGGFRHLCLSQNQQLASASIFHSLAMSNDLEYKQLTVTCYTEQNFWQVYVPGTVALNVPLDTL